MSTTHDLVKMATYDREVELSITEQSCMLQFSMQANLDGDHSVISVYDLTAEQARDVALRILAAASYCSEDPEEFMSTAKEMVDYHSINKLDVVSVKS